MKRERPQRTPPKAASDPWPLVCELCTGAGETQERLEDVRLVRFIGPQGGDHKFRKPHNVILWVQCKMCSGRGTIEQ